MAKSLPAPLNPFTFSETIAGINSGLNVYEIKIMCDYTTNTVNYRGDKIISQVLFAKYVLHASNCTTSA